MLEATFRDTELEEKISTIVRILESTEVEDHNDETDEDLKASLISLDIKKSIIDKFRY